LQPSPRNYDPKKDEDITPFELRIFKIVERARNWTMEMSKRDNNIMCDVVRYRSKYF